MLQATLFVKVVLALLSDRPAATYLDTQRDAHHERMRELTAMRKAGPLSRTMLADYGLFHLEADLRWIDMTAARLDQLRIEIRPMNTILSADGLTKSFGATVALQGATMSLAARRDPRRHGAERIRQVDAAALPGRHLRAGQRRRDLRRPRPVRAVATASAPGCAAPTSGSCSSSASSCRN